MTENQRVEPEVKLFLIWNNSNEEKRLPYPIPNITQEKETGTRDSKVN